MKRRATNEELISHLMNFAKTGPLMQAVVIEGLRKYCEAVVAQPVGFFGSVNNFVSEDAWRACCQEYLDTLANRDSLTVDEQEEED